MLTLRFIPIFEDPEFLIATQEYEEIWKQSGTDIVQTYKELTGLDFIEERIAIVIYEGMSLSGRFTGDIMKIRASYDTLNKKGTLVHELGHRLIAQLKNRKPEIDEHQTLFLFLYDVWVKLWGQEFADTMVISESARTGYYDYASAWQWAQSLSLKDRTLYFEEIKKLN
jgi:hypothetical protein